MENYNQFRNEYPEFIYHSFSLEDDGANLVLSYHFSVPGLAEFRPKLTISKKKFELKDISSEVVQNLVFSIGLVELVSYWKATCSPKVIIECGELSEAQVAWWKKLYYNGLGELFYRNGIEADFENFMRIESRGQSATEEATQGGEAAGNLAHEEQGGAELETALAEGQNSRSATLADDAREFSGYVIPIGGGKDSVVTLETLPLDRERDYCFIINPKPTTRKCAELAGFSDERVIEIWRQIDPNLLELNSRGFINGHTPFSALLAFTSYLCAYLLGKKYIAVSNESSANEANVCLKEGACPVNHQYSKSLEFENDFRSYAKAYFDTPVEYFSFLRPLNELQIACIFSKLTPYHPVFKSCNVGSKGEVWHWCGACAKCLFAFIILSPFLYRERLVEIFGQDLFEKAELTDIFLELIGRGETKPFDCVGTFEEVNYALGLTIRRLKDRSEVLPALLEYYDENYGDSDAGQGYPDGVSENSDASENLLDRFDNKNNLNNAQVDALKNKLKRSRHA